MTNNRTRLVYFLLLPLADLLLMVLISSQYSNSIRWRVAIATVLVNGVSLAISTVATLLVLDNNQGIDLFVLANASRSLKYWYSKVITAFLVSFVGTLLSLLILVLLSAPIKLVLLAILLSIPLIISGIIVGITCWVAAWGLENPYLFSNGVSSVMVLVCGNLVSLNLYPAWLKYFSMLFPFGATIGKMVNNSVPVTHDIFVDLVWLIIGGVMYVIMRHRVLEGVIKRH
ncbi:antibiotic transporter permease [Furfurilactobacillus rossiae]|nr:antibiotic transporter permease [Furfurilactobacillus rossiae]